MQIQWRTVFGLLLVLAASGDDVRGAMTRLTNLLIGYVAPLVVFVLAILGLAYIITSATGDMHRTVQIRLAIMGIVGGALLVLFAASFGADLISALKP